MAKVTSKGQITIPVSIRRRLGINDGDKLLFIDSPDGVIMVNPDFLPSRQSAAPLRSEVDSLASRVAESTARADGLVVAIAGPLENDGLAEGSGIGGFMAAKQQGEAAMPEQDTGAAQSMAGVTGTPGVTRTPGAPAATAKPAPLVDGQDIGALLDEIRSIGSKI